MAEHSWSGKVGGGNLAEKLPPPESETGGWEGAMVTSSHEQVSLGLYFADGDIHDLEGC